MLLKRMPFPVEYMAAVLIIIAIFIACTIMSERNNEVLQPISHFSIKTGLTDSTVSFSQSPEEILRQLEDAGFRLEWIGLKNASYYEIRVSRNPVTEEKWKDADSIGTVLQSDGDTITTTISRLTPRVKIERCILCKDCGGVCPNGAINFSDSFAVIDPSKCRGCGECIRKCRTKTITDLSMGRAYHFAVRAYDKNKKTISTVRTTAQRYLMRYTNWKKTCGKCGKACHILLVPPEKGCPRKAIFFDTTGLIHIDTSKCINCGRCMKICTMTFGLNSIRKEVIATK